LPLFAAFELPLDGDATTTVRVIRMGQTISSRLNYAGTGSAQLCRRSDRLRRISFSSPDLGQESTTYVKTPADLPAGVRPGLLAGVLRLRHLEQVLADRREAEAVRAVLQLRLALVAEESADPEPASSAVR
jgi:hypothetical protein